MGSKITKLNFHRKGTLGKLEIKDETYRLLHRSKYNLTNKKDLKKLLMVLEKYSGFTIMQIIKSEWI